MEHKIYILEQCKDPCYDVISADFSTFSTFHFCHVDFSTFLSVPSMPTAPSTSVGTVAAYGWRSRTVRSHSSADGSDRDTRRIRIPYGGRYRYSLPEPYRAQCRAVVLLQYRCTHTPVHTAAHSLPVGSGLRVPPHCTASLWIDSLPGTRIQCL